MAGGGFLGAELKHSGFEAIIAEGNAKTPVYLSVHDGEAEMFRSQILEDGSLFPQAPSIFAASRMLIHSI
jgi:aldehyde:ferredoxin oxidoreductase